MHAAVLPVWGIEGGHCACPAGAACNEKPGKHPLGSLAPHGHLDATRDPAVVTKWWTLHPKANVGVRTDEGLAVIDLDGAAGALSWDELRAGRDSVDTVVAQTGGDGRHLYFTAPPFPKGRRVALWPGLDLRADGGYVVAPPSMHISGKQYVFEASSTPVRVPIAPMPDWLHEAFCARILELSKTKSKPAGKAAAPARPLSPHGERNAYLTSCAGRLRRQGQDAASILKHLQLHYDLDCAHEPPMGAEELKAIAASVGKYPAGADDPADAGKAKKGPKQADVLVELATAGAELFHDEGTPYAVLAMADHKETWRVSSTSFRQWLSGKYFERTGGVPSREAITDALCVLEGRALFNSPEAKTFLRLGGAGEAIYLDLGNEAWEVVEITGAGWRVTKECPIRFRRTRGMRPLPTPARGGQGTEPGRPTWVHSSIARQP
jgi:hypothetical protein